jgi:hypothetical protein
MRLIPAGLCRKNIQFPDEFHKMMQM